jgi:hypothetical protein
MSDRYLYYTLRKLRALIILELRHRIFPLGPEHSLFLWLFFFRPIPSLHHSEYRRLDSVSVQVAQRVNTSHGMVEIPWAQNLTFYYPVPCQAVSGAVIINVN